MSTEDHNTKKRLRLTIKDLQGIAAEHGGKCLSEEYIRARSRYRFECSEGHQWECMGSTLLRGKWCTKCTRRNRCQYTIKDMQALARTKGGKCLSVVYTNSITPLLWSCLLGHEWMARMTQIRDGHWCPSCAGLAKKTIDDMRMMAKSKGGTCLSSVYENIKSSLIWECANGHKFIKSPHSIQQGSWCYVCAKGVKSLEDMQALAKSRGGKCLSLSYKGVYDKLSWECNCGFQWTVQAQSVISGVWCQECRAHSGERISRIFFEQLFHEKFPKMRPRWMKNPYGSLLELDGYCEKLCIAFEHQGIQHFQEHPFFHSSCESHRTFSDQQDRDQKKRDLCAQHGVVLIEVPSILEMLGVSNVKAFIRTELLRTGVALPAGFDETTVDLSSLYVKADELQLSLAL